jgi:hypothetical protein
MIIAIWEGACPADYDVYVGETDENMVKLYSITGHTQQNWYDRFAGQPMKNVKFIKLVTTKNATGYGIKLHDLKAYGTASDASKATQLLISADNNYISTDETIQISTSVLDQFGAVMPDAKVELSVDNDGILSDDNVFTPNGVNTYTLTATCGTLTETLLLEVIADKDTKLSLDYQATMNGDDVNLSNEVSFTELNVPLIITFNKEYDFSLIKIRWEAACPSDYTVTATYSDDNTATILAVADRSFEMGYNPIDRVWDKPNGIIQQNGSMRSNDVSGSASLKAVTGLTILPTAQDHNYTIRLFGIDTYGSVNNDSTSSVALTQSDETNSPVNVYSLTGILLRSDVTRADALKDLPRGIYIVGGKKVVK